MTAIQIPSTEKPSRRTSLAVFCTGSVLRIGRYGERVLVHGCRQDFLPSAQAAICGAARGITHD